MWAMYRSSRELIKMQDLQKLGKLAAACSHLESSGGSVWQGQHPRQMKQHPPNPCPSRRDSSPVAWTAPTWKHLPEDLCDLLVGLLGHPLL